MTPLEINLKIAKLKNIEVLQTIESKIYYKGESGYAKRGITQYAAEPLKSYNWAESIQDAWGLFEEMPKSSFVKHLGFDDGEKCGKFECLLYAGPKDSKMRILEKWVEITADTAPLAICLAWIQWKESQR